MPVMPELPKHILPLFEKFCADREKLSFENGYARGKADGASEVMNGLRTISAFLPTAQPQVGPQLAPPIMLSEKPQKPSESEPDFDISDLLQDVFGDDWDEEDKDALIQLAMVSVQEAYKSKGKDASAILNRLRMLADDDELFRDVVSGKQNLAWQRVDYTDGRKRKYQFKAVDDQTNKTKYGAAAQAVLAREGARGNKTNFEGKVATRAAKEDWETFDSDLESLTLRELKGLREKLSKTFIVDGDKRKKGTWVAALKTLITEVMKVDAAKPEAKAESKTEPAPKEEPVADVASEQEEPDTTESKTADADSDINYDLENNDPNDGSPQSFWVRWNNAMTGKTEDMHRSAAELIGDALRGEYGDEAKDAVDRVYREGRGGKLTDKYDAVTEFTSQFEPEFKPAQIDDEEPDFAPTSEMVEPSADLQAEPKNYDENKVKLHKKISQIIDDDIQPMDAELMEKLSERYGVPKREVLRTYRQVMGRGADVSRDEIVNPTEEFVAEQPVPEPVRQEEPSTPAKPKGLTKLEQFKYKSKRDVEDMLRKEQKVPDHVLEHYGLGKKETPVELPATPDAVKRELKASAEGKRQASTEGIANESEKQKQDRLQKESVEKELSSLIGTELIDDVMIDAISAKTKAKPTAIKKMVKDMTEIAIDDELTEAHAEGNVDDVLLDDLSERYGVDRKTLDSKYKKVKSGKGLKEIKAVDAPVEDKAELDKFDTGTFVGDNATPEMERLAREKAGIDESESLGLPKRDNTPDGISPEQRDRLKKFTDANNAINVDRSDNELAALPAKVQANVANIEQLDPSSEDYRDKILDVLGAMSRVDRAKVASALKVPETAITMDAIADAIVKQNEKRAKKGAKSKADDVTTESDSVTEVTPEATKEMETPTDDTPEYEYPNGSLFEGGDSELPEFDKLERLAASIGIHPDSRYFKSGTPEFRKKQLIDAIEDKIGYNHQPADGVDYAAEEINDREDIPDAIKDFYLKVAKEMEDEDLKENDPQAFQDKKWREERDIAIDAPYKLTKDRFIQHAHSIEVESAISPSGTKKFTKGQLEKWRAENDKNPDIDYEISRYTRNGRAVPNNYVIYVRPSHKKIVSDALAAGNTVPPEVLAEYPELQKSSNATKEMETPTQSSPAASAQSDALAKPSKESGESGKLTSDAQTVYDELTGNGRKIQWSDIGDGGYDAEFLGEQLGLTTAQVNKALKEISNNRESLGGGKATAPKPVQTPKPVAKPTPKVEAKTESKVKSKSQTKSELPPEKRGIHGGHVLPHRDPKFTEIGNQILDSGADEAITKAYNHLTQFREFSSGIVDYPTLFRQVQDTNPELTDYQIKLAIIAMDATGAGAMHDMNEVNSFSKEDKAYMIEDEEGRRSAYYFSVSPKAEAGGSRPEIDLDKLRSLSNGKK